jgi:hypothetical protein
MDTSEIYIEMCRQAEEIQDLQSHLFGDFRYNHVFNDIQIINYHSSMDDQEIYTWLPRQDQLQEIVFREPNPFIMLGRIFNFVRRNFQQGDEDLKKLSTTWEQLWLAFVMKEKFNKTWNGEDWA